MDVRSWIRAYAFLLVLLGTLAMRVWRTVADPDLWGHLQHGLDKIEAGGYISTDPYSYLTAGQHWFDHNWLGEIIMAAVYFTGGDTWFQAVKLVIACGVVTFLYLWLLREGISALRATLVLLPGVLLLIPTLGTFRPQLFTLVAFTAVIALIRLFEEGSISRRVLFWITPLLFALWVNLHGGVIAGIVVLWTWATLYAVARRRGENRFWPGAVAVISTVVLGLNPNGYSHIWFLVRTTTVPRPEIVEWGPVDLTSGIGVAYLVAAAAVILLLWRNRKDFYPPTDLPLLALCLAPALSMRHLQLFVPAVIILGSRHIAAATGRDRIASLSRVPMATAAVLSVAFALLWVFGAASVGKGCVVLDPQQFVFPTRALHAIEESGYQGDAVVPFNWGEYVLWHLGPELQVSIDGRREVIYSDEVLRANLDFQTGSDGWDRLLGMGDPELVLLPTGSGGDQLMRSYLGWTLIYEDTVASVYVPNDSSVRLVGDPALSVDGSGTCFPG